MTLVVQNPSATPFARLPCPNTYARLLLQRWPDDADALFAGTGLNAAHLRQQETISVAEQLQVLRNARQLFANPNWALEFGRQLSINSHGPLGFAAISAPTLAAGIEVLSRFARIRAPYLAVELAVAGSQLQIRYDVRRHPLGDLEAALVEILQQVLLSYLRVVLGEEYGDLCLCFTCAAHGHASRYRNAFAVECRYAAPFNGLCLPAALRAVPSPLHDESVYRSSLARCRQALDGILGVHDAVLRATHWLAAHFEQIAVDDKAARLPQLEQLARAWGVTSRTVIRQLAAQGARFAELRSAQQLDRARCMLDDARYTVTEVGYRLGYGDPANFRRAFRRLTGVSPSDYRRRTR